MVEIGFAEDHSISPIAFYSIILDKNIIVNSSVSLQSTKIKNQHELSDILSKDDLQNKGKNFAEGNAEGKRRSGAVCFQASKSLTA